MQNSVVCFDPRLLLNHCEEVVVVIDHALRLVYWNDCQSCLVTGAMKHQVGHSIRDIFPPTLDNLFETELHKAAQAQHPCEMIVDFPTVGRFVLRGFPHGEDLYAIFLRELMSRESGFRVQEDVATYSIKEYGTYSKELEVALREREAAVREFERGREFQRRFLTEVLTNVTDGRLRLCSQEADLPGLLPPIGEAIPLTTPQALAPFRRHIEAASTIVGLPAGRTRELIIAAGEAAMNSIVHAGAGAATVHGVADGMQMQICVTDTGSGIADDNLHRATLERGYTTAGSLGLGFSLMHSVADRVYLLTRSSGTTVILEQDAVPETHEETLFPIAFK